MSFVLSMSMLLLGIINGKDALFIASSIFAVASAIESFAYKYFKNK